MKFRTCLYAAAAFAIVGYASGAAAASHTIAGIVFQEDQFFRTIELGMQAAAKAAGATLLQANSESKPDKEASLIDTFTARGVEAIVISPISEKASATALKRAADKGIKIVTYNTTVTGDIATAFLTSQQSDLGKTSGIAAKKFIADKLGGKAKVAVLAFKAAFPEISAQRVGGFTDEIKSADVQVVGQQDAWLAEKAVAVASDIITANPDLNIIYAANEGGTVGAVQAVRRAGKQGKIFVFGVDGSEQLGNFLLDDDNVLQATTAQQPFEMGKQAVEIAIAAIDGKAAADKNILVPVLGLTRTDPDGVKKFLAMLKTFQ
jgi:ABC-type sugar transport system substrate-binding protein